MGITIIAGELDLSVGSVAAVSGIIAVSLVEDIGLVPAVLASALAGLVFGAAQGYLVHRLKVHSLVLTLGSLIALRGLAFMISGENTVAMENLDIAFTVRTQLGLFSPFSLVTILVFALVGFFLLYTRFGREIFAVGGGRNEAAAAGVPPGAAAGADLRPVGFDSGAGRGDDLDQVGQRPVRPPSRRCSFPPPPPP